MYFVSYEYDGLKKAGILNSEKNAVIPVDEIIKEDSPLDMLELIRCFSNEYVDMLKKACSEQQGIALSKVKLLSPIPQPFRNIICVGKNYIEHIKEVAKNIGGVDKIPEYPIYFSKMFDKILGPGDYIPSHDDITERLDYECELAVIIGREGKDIPYDNAENYIFGYTILNDISVRDVQSRHLQWFKGKSLDGTCAIGPYIIHKSAVSYPPKLDIMSKINGEVRQNSNTSNFIFNISTLISDFSRGLTLKPGDIIATGTPSGVGMGFNPPKFLKHGDTVECTIENIGTLKNIIN